MNRSYRFGFVLLASCSAIACGDDKESIPKKRTFGPEWTLEGDNYKKKVEIEASHHATINTGATSYKIDLERHRLHAIESDDSSGCFASIEIGKNRSVGAQIRRNEKNEVYLINTESNRVIYYDFDCDGVYDAYIDPRGKEVKMYILVENTFTEIRESKDAFRFRPSDKNPAPRTSIDGTKKYSFENGKWKES